MDLEISSSERYAESISAFESAFDEVKCNGHKCNGH